MRLPGRARAVAVRWWVSEKKAFGNGGLLIHFIKVDDKGNQDNHPQLSSSLTRFIDSRRLAPFCVVSYNTFFPGLTSISLLPINVSK